MTREEKTEKRIQRSIRRKETRMKWYVNKIQKARQYGSNVPLNTHNREGYQLGTSWWDPESPTKWTQICSYDVWGTCPSPCNGDC
jgi:hypothetical protein